MNTSLFLGTPFSITWNLGKFYRNTLMVISPSKWGIVRTKDPPLAICNCKESLREKPCSWYHH